MIVSRIGPVALGLLLNPPSSFVDADVFLMRTPPMLAGGGEPPLRPPPSSLDELETSFLESVDAVHRTCGADVATVCPTPEERFLADLSGGSDPILSALFAQTGGVGGDIDDFLRSVIPPPSRPMAFGPREDPLGALLDEFVETAILAAGAPFPPPPPPEAKEEEEEAKEEEEEGPRAEGSDAVAVEDRSVENEREDTSGFEDEELLGAVASEEEEKAARAEAVLDAMVGRLAERYSSGSDRSKASEDRDDEVAADALLTDEELAQRIARHGVALAKVAEEPKPDSEEGEAKVQEDEDPELRRRLARRLSEVDETFFAVPGGFVIFSEIEPRKIVRAVYDDPALKSAVQERVGESLGDAPPLGFGPRRREVVLVEDEEARLPALHFGCRRDGCLWEARERGAVSPPCARAMDLAKGAFNDLLRAQEEPQSQGNERRDAVVIDHRPTVHRERIDFVIDPQMRSAAQAQRRQKDLKVAAEVSALSAFLLSFSLSLTVFVLLRLAFRRRRGGGKFGRMRMRMGLRRKIMAAVYDDPTLKSAVEEKVGESLGDAPPPHPHRRGPGRRREKCGLFHRFCRSLPLAGLAILLVLTSLTNPDAVLLVGGSTLVCMTLYGALASCFCSSSEDESVEGRERANEGACCCCGASPSDGGAAGDETSSCSCCNGTGVCGPDCAVCGSQANKGYPGALALERRREGAPAAAYVGVPVQVV